MVQIQINNAKRFPSYIEISYKLSFVLPAIYGTGTTPIKGLSTILSSFPDGFSSEIVSGNGTVIVFSETVSVNLNVTLAQIKTQLIARYAAVRTKLDALTLSPTDTIAGLSYDGTIWT